MRLLFNFDCFFIMRFLRLRLIFSFLFTILALAASAQDSAIGYWESHLPYNNAVGLATDGKTLFAAGVQAFYSYDPTSMSTPVVPYSKAEGMSDIGMQCIGYDGGTGTAVLVYANGNIDLFKDNTFYNVADLKTKSVSGTKQVFQVYTEPGYAYFSTSLGVLVLDLSSQTFKQTFQFINEVLNNEIIPVQSFTGTDLYFYAATPIGLFRANKNSPQLQNYQVWKKVDSTHALTSMANVNGTLFFSTPTAVYTMVADTLQLVYNVPPNVTIQHLDQGGSNLFVSTYNDTTYIGSLKTFNTAGTMTDSTSWSGKPVQAVQRLDGTVWVADFFLGLSKIFEHGSYPYIPNGPADPSTFDIYAHNKTVYVAHGGYTTSYAANSNGNGISMLSNGKWDGLSQAARTAQQTMRDMSVVLKDEKKGTFFAGSFQGGLLIQQPDQSVSVVKGDIFDSSTVYFGQGQRQVVGLALDKSDNLWVSTFGSLYKLYARSAADSTWYKFFVPGASNGGPLVVDDNGQVWFACYQEGLNGGGVAVYNNGGTLNDPSDDASYVLVKGAGAGNLPSNRVFCIAKDNSNNIWVGTDNGIGIVGNCSAPFSQTPPCDAEIPIVQYDQYAGYLFAGNAIRTIAVDGANRKWVGTDDGVWLLSPDASKIVYRFNVDNSPLPSNHIQKITVDHVTGDVYIGTEMGLVSYRSTATGGGETNSNVLVFPNPVKAGYTGPIAIKGLVTNGDVRITDIAGKLVYRTTANGGQCVWNGLDYTGRRPQSGVYLVFVSNSDGSQTYAAKIVFTQ
jgi:Two component regulator propeller